jgi:hypothetical protein
VQHHMLAIAARRTTATLSTAVPTTTQHMDITMAHVVIGVVIVAAVVTLVAAVTATAAILAAAEAAAAVVATANAMVVVRDLPSFLLSASSFLPLLS